MRDLNINIKLALLDNPEQYMHIISYPDTKVLYGYKVDDKDEDVLHSCVIDYIHDSNLTLPLFCKLCQAGYRMSWILKKYYQGDIMKIQKEDVNRAICLCYLEVYGNE